MYMMNDLWPMTDACSSSLLLMMLVWQERQSCGCSDWHSLQRLEDKVVPNSTTSNRRLSLFPTSRCEHLFTYDP